MTSTPLVDVVYEATEQSLADCGCSDCGCGCDPTLSFWLVEQGANVALGDEICEIELGDGGIVVTASCAGVIEEILRPESATLSPADVLARIRPI